MKAITDKELKVLNAGDMIFDKDLKKWVRIDRIVNNYFYHIGSIIETPDTLKTDYQI